jgi:acetyl esterase/lipase
MDVELQPFIASFPPADLTDPLAARRDLAELSARGPAPDTTDLTIEDRAVPADPDVPVRTYRPQRPHGAVVWLHGGGFVMGDLDTEHPWAVRIAAGSGAVVVSVGYRRAPEHPFPAALDDAYTALVWTFVHAAELGIAPDRIAVGGHAAGAGLAAAVALRSRDRQGPPIRFQLLNQPQLDDRQQTWSARNFTETPFMTRAKVAASWRHYLGAATTSPDAAPARADDVSGPTGHRRSCRQRCPNDRSPNSAPSCTVPSPAEQNLRHALSTRCSRTAAASSLLRASTLRRPSSSSMRWIR